jgi:hypothetical protein
LSGELAGMGVCKSQEMSPDSFETCPHATHYFVIAFEKIRKCALFAQALDPQRIHSNEPTGSNPLYPRPSGGAGAEGLKKQILIS